jgi:hypothetical protein
MKRIKRFREEPYGWNIDLEDTEASVAVDPVTGDILLNEGAGADRFHGAAISRSAFYEFQLDELRDAEYQLVLKYSLTGVHVLGVTRDKSHAEDWIRSASEAIRFPRRLQDLPRRRPPFALPEQAGSPCCFRVRNSRVRDIKFVLEPWGERYALEPDAALDVVCCGPQGEHAEIESGEGVITVNAGKKSLVRLFVVSLGALRRATPSAIVEEEVNRVRQFGEFTLSERVMEELQHELGDANRTIDAQLASDSVDRKNVFLRCGTIAGILSGNARGEYRLKRECVWRLAVRLLQLVDCELELYESVADDLLTHVETSDEMQMLEWFESRSRVASPPVPCHGILIGQPA